MAIRHNKRLWSPDSPPHHLKLAHTSSLGLLVAPLRCIVQTHCKLLMSTGHFVCPSVWNEFGQKHTYDNSSDNNVRTSNFRCYLHLVWIKSHCLRQRGKNNHFRSSVGSFVLVFVDCQLAAAIAATPMMMIWFKSVWSDWWASVNIIRFCECVCVCARNRDRLIPIVGVNLLQWPKSGSMFGLVSSWRSKHFLDYTC